jgi:hypothetical protein
MSTQTRLSSLSGQSPVPSVAVPLKIAADSYPCINAESATAVPQDLSQYGYVGEEYLVGGKANLYGFESSGKGMIETPDAPYTTRILVRRPVEKSRFSGHVIVELLNPSLLYDWDPQWMCSMPQACFRASNPNTY